MMMVSSGNIPGKGEGSCGITLDTIIAIGVTNSTTAGAISRLSLLMMLFEDILALKVISKGLGGFVM